MDSGMLLQVATVVCGVGGSLLNAERRVEGFYFWLVSNILLGYISYLTAQYGLVLLYVFYTITCLRGIVKWRKAEVSDAK